jgi:hypothetical protein
MKNNFIKKLRVLRVLRGELKAEPKNQPLIFTNGKTTNRRNTNKIIVAY